MALAHYSGGVCYCPGGPEPGRRWRTRRPTGPGEGPGPADALPGQRMPAADVPRAGPMCSSLIATGRPSTRSFARQTSLKPPAPTRSSSSYRRPSVMPKDHISPGYPAITPPITQCPSSGSTISAAAFLIWPLDETGHWCRISLRRRPGARPSPMRPLRHARHSVLGLRRDRGLLRAPRDAYYPRSRGRGRYADSNDTR
jgi:hypothetical protein